MVRAVRILRRYQLDIVVGLVAWLGMRVMAHPSGLVAAIGDERLSHTLAFQLGSGVAFCACAALTLPSTCWYRKLAWI